MKHQRQQIVFRDATLADALSLAPRLRAGDLLEITLASGQTAEYVLVQSIGLSDGTAFAAIESDTGVVIAMGGVVAHGEVGVPWLLGSEEVRKYPAVLICAARDSTLEWSKKHPTLINFVHAENRLAIRWLKHIGYTLGQLFPSYGAGKAPFYQFYRTNK
jgi:hypothetical protein